MDQTQAFHTGVPSGTPIPATKGLSGKRIDSTPMAAGALVIGAVVVMSVLRRALRGTVL